MKESDTSLEAALAEAWQDELFGEALMRSLATRLEDGAEHAAELSAIARIEGLMARALARALPKPRDASAALSAAHARAEKTAAAVRTWRAFLDMSEPGLMAASTRFRMLPAARSRALAQVVGLLVRHEDALIAYLRGSAAGLPAESNDALKAIERELSAFIGMRA